ncbi:MAG: hypothetical protein QXJ06_00505 [Candidatus Aenigmatarchaeota archaeon]
MIYKKFLCLYCFKRYYKHKSDAFTNEYFCSQKCEDKFNEDIEKERRKEEDERNKNTK